MDYIKMNKDAWEEAFDNRFEGYGENNDKYLITKEYPFIEKAIIEELEELNLQNKRIAQFCCNNGRELLAIIKKGNNSGVGFDIAENLIKQAKETSIKSNIPCDFVVCNILEIDEKYYGQFDLIVITIGALCWFKDLNQFFHMVSKCLKKHGTLIINDMHPFTNMIAMRGEEMYDVNNLTKFVYSYFKTDPFISNNGIEYMCKKEYNSKTFVSFTHTFSNIINEIVEKGMSITKIREFEYDISDGFEELNNKGFPLSYIIKAQKN